MNTYSNKIALIRNSRGVYCIDTVMGCPSGMAQTDGGCYGDCYAARAAKRYGKDFAVAVLRDFENEGHKARIRSQISRVKMPFIRIGASGDPSENWEHTMMIVRQLATSNTELVIITRHWNLLSDGQLEELSRMNMCVNTSVSALDSDRERERALRQFDRIKPYCKSVLRIISCDFNLAHEGGRLMAKIQADLFSESPTIDTVFRPTKSNQLVTEGVVNVRNEIFNGRKQLASKLNRRTYMGKCETCSEMCGVNLTAGRPYSGRPGIERQELLAL